MDMAGEYRFPVARERVWEALNDADILKRCIPGCEELVRESDTELHAKVLAKVGPVRAKFDGSVILSDLDPPNGYSLDGEGKGGPAGFAKGGAKVRLAEDGGETVLNYTVHATVGGKLAQIGSRVVDATARKMAGEFFAQFAEQLGGVAVPPPAPAEAEAAAERKGLPPLVWVGGVIVAVIVLLLLFAG